MRRRRKYDAKFKAEAVELLLNSDKSIAEVSANLGVERSCLGRWRQEYLEGRDGGGGKVHETGRKPADLEQENRRLRKELRQVTQEREILKKAISIFSRDPQRYTGS